MKMNKINVTGRINCYASYTLSSFNNRFDYTIQAKISQMKVSYTSLVSLKLYSKRKLKEDTTKYKTPLN